MPLSPAVAASYPYVDVYVCTKNNCLAVGIWTFRFVSGNGLQLLVVDAANDLVLIQRSVVSRVTPRNDDEWQCVVDSATGRLQARFGSSQFKTLGCVGQRPDSSFKLSDISAALGVNFKDLKQVPIGVPREGQQLSEFKLPNKKPSKTEPEEPPGTSEAVRGTLDSLCDFDVDGENKQ